MLRNTVRAVHVVSRTLGIISAAAIMALMLAITADVIGRELRGRSVPGLLEVAEILLAVAVFLGLAVCQHQGGHIRVTLVTDRLPEGAARGVRLVALSLGLALIAALAYATGSVAIDSYLAGEARFGLLAVPTWPGRAAVCVGLIALLGEILVSMHGVWVRERSRGPRASDAI